MGKLIMREKFVFFKRAGKNMFLGREKALDLKKTVYIS